MQQRSTLHSTNLQDWSPIIKEFSIKPWRLIGVAVGAFYKPLTQGGTKVDMTFNNEAKPILYLWYSLRKRYRRSWKKVLKDNNGWYFVRVDLIKLSKKWNPGRYYKNYTTESISVFQYIYICIYIYIYIERERENKRDRKWVRGRERDNEQTIYIYIYIYIISSPCHPASTDFQDSPLSFVSIVNCIQQVLQTTSCVSTDRAVVKF